MANSRVYLKSEAGGTTVVSRDTTANSGNLVLPASGNVTSVDTAVTDNAIARYDSTTGKLQNSGVVIDDSNRLLVGNTPSGLNTLGQLIVNQPSSGNVNLVLTNKINDSYSYIYNDGTALKIINSYNTTAGYTPIILQTGGSDRLILDVNGNVGIGVTPTEKLHLYNGSASNVIIKTQNSAASCQYGNDNAGFAYAWSVDAPAMFVGTNKSDGHIRLYAGGGEKARLDNNGNLLLTSGTGGLGYGTGSGGTVTQLTSKSTAVTLNKPSGTIITSNSALSAGATVSFAVNNSLISVIDTIIINCNIGNYRVVAFSHQGQGTFTVSITNITGVLLSETLYIDFAIIKGANS